MPDGVPQRDQTMPFAAFVQQQAKGRLHAEMSDELAQLVAAVVKTGKAGKFSLTLNIKPEGDDAISVATSYAAKIPQPPAKPSLFFADEQGHISRQRLNQPELPLRGVDGGASSPTTTQDAQETGA